MTTTRNVAMAEVETTRGRRSRAAERAEQERAALRAAGRCIGCKQPSQTYRCAPCRAIADANVTRYRGRGRPGRQPNLSMDREDLASALEALGRGLKLTVDAPDVRAAQRGEADPHEIERLSQAVLGVRFALLVLRRNAKRLPIAIEDLLDDDDLDQPERPALGHHHRRVSRTRAGVRGTAPAEVSAPFERGAETAPAPEVSTPDDLGVEILAGDEVSTTPAPVVETTPAAEVSNSLGGESETNPAQEVSATPAAVAEISPARCEP